MQATQRVGLFQFVAEGTPVRGCARESGGRGLGVAAVFGEQRPGRRRGVLTGPRGEMNLTPSGSFKKEYPGL